MPTYAIGQPGGPSRICEFNNPRSLELNIKAGEVAIEIAAFAEGRIADDGASFIEHLPDLAERKAERWTEAKRVRRKRMTGGIAFAGVGLIDTRDDAMKPSQLRIEQAAGEATRAFVRGLPYSKLLTLADNSTAEVDAEVMMAIGDAVTAHLQACQDACSAIRLLIDAAEDQAALDAINITAGYPALPA